MKSLDPLRANKTVIRKELGHAMVSATDLSLISDPIILQKEPEENTVNLQVVIMAVVSKTDISRKYQNISNLLRK